MKRKCFATIILSSAISMPAIAEDIDMAAAFPDDTPQSFSVAQANDNQNNAPQMLSDAQNQTSESESVIVDMNGNLKVVPKTKANQPGNVPTNNPNANIPQPIEQPATTQPPPTPALGYAPEGSPPPTVQMPSVQAVPPASTTLQTPAQPALGQPTVPGAPSPTNPGVPSTQSLETVPPASQTLQTQAPQQVPIGQSTLPSFNQAPNASQPPFNQNPVSTTVQPAGTPPAPPVNQPPGGLPQGAQQTSMEHYDGSELASRYDMVNGQDNIPG